jgi:hypothetical protein
MKSSVVPRYRRTFRSDARRDDLLEETMRRGAIPLSKARARRIKLALLLPSWPLELCPEQRYRALAARAVRWRALPARAAEVFLTLWEDKLPAARRAALLARLRVLKWNLCEDIPPPLEAVLLPPARVVH